VCNVTMLPFENFRLFDCSQFSRLLAIFQFSSQFSQNQWLVELILPGPGFEPVTSRVVGRQCPCILSHLTQVSHDCPF
jgi:hypothetical protein